MRVLGRHPGHGWKGLEDFEKTKRGMERRTRSWCERHNHVTASNNEDSGMAAVV